MKIYNNPNVNQVMNVYNKTAVKKADGKVSTHNIKDEIQLSNKAKDFQTAMKAFKNLPEVREDLVNDLKDKINQGTYNVTGGEVADKIIESALLDSRI